MESRSSVNYTILGVTYPLMPGIDVMLLRCVGIGELIGGSQREDRLERLLMKLKDNNLKEEDYWWYLDLRRYEEGIGV